MSMTLKVIGAVAAVTLNTVSGVQIGDTMELGTQADMQNAATSHAALLDSQQYLMQIKGTDAPVAPGWVAAGEQCSQLHDPAICDDKTGKCTMLVNNAESAPDLNPPVDVPAAAAPAVATSPAGVAAPAVLAEAAPVAAAAQPAVPAPASLLEVDLAPEMNLAFKHEPFKMVVFQKDKYVSRMAICHGKSWENNLVQSFLQGPLQGKKEWNFLDVGTNLGSWSLPAALNLKGHGGKVISVEADPQTIGTFKESVAMNSLLDSVEFVQKAVVKDSKALTSICLSMVSDISKEENIGGNQAALGDRKVYSCAKEVQTMTLDDMYASNPVEMKKVAAMKLDCEGCEGGAILGAHKFLTESAPCFIAMEITEGYLCDSGTPLQEIKDFLHNHGYDVSKIQGPTGGTTCADYKAYEKKNAVPVNSVQDFVQMGRRDPADAAACMARFQDGSSNFKL